jgi:hypothetical protein
VRRCDGGARTPAPARAVIAAERSPGRRRSRYVSR